MERLRFEDLLNDVAPNFDVFGTLFKELFQNVAVDDNQHCEFHLVLFKPSTHSLLKLRLKAVKKFLNVFDLFDHQQSIRSSLQIFTLLMIK